MLARRALRRNVVLTIIILLGLVAAACGSSATPTPESPQTIVVSVKKIGGLQGAPFFVALESGYFSDEGLELELRNLGGRTTLEGLRDGEIKMAIMTSRRIARAFVEGESTELVAFALLLKRPHHNLLIKEEVAAAKGITADSPLADKISALRGLTIIHGPRAEPFVTDILMRGGVGADEVNRLLLDQVDQAPAFINGDAEVCFCHTPALEDALFGGEGLLLISLSEGEIGDYSDLNWIVMITTAQIAQEEPDLLIKTARAIARAQRLILADTPDERPAGRALRGAFQEVSAESFRFARDLMFAATADNPIMDVNKMATGATLYGISMTVEQAEQVVNNEFAEEALRSLGN